MRRASPAGSSDGRRPASSWMASMVREHDQPGIQRDEQHDADQASRTANARGRGPSTAIATMLTSRTPPHAYAT